MGLCKCPKRKVTNLFCFEHRVNVCEHCLVANHAKVGPVGEPLSGALGRQIVLTSSKFMKDLELDWKLHEGKDLVIWVTAISPAIKTESSTQCVLNKCLLIEQTKG